MMTKKIVLGMTMLLSSMAFVGCVSDVSDSNYTYDKLNAQYAQKFEQTFGKIAANQDWGFDAAVMRGATASEEDLKGYVIPDEMTKNEGEAAYTAVFSASDDQYKGMKVSLADIMKVVDLKNYYLQYVGTKNNNTHINSQTYSNGAVFEDMERIEAYDYNNKKWVEVLNFEKGQYKKSVFKESNIVAHNLMFMMDMGTPDGNQPQFRWKSKRSKNPKKDVEPYYYDYDFLKIGDDYFVMLYYIDSPRAGWLIRIGTAEKEEEDPVAQRGRIFCEDLGESNVSDFDFNDVVFDAVIYKDGHIDIEILAAGGTLPIYVAEQLVTLGKMTNTGVNEAPRQKFTIPAVNGQPKYATLNNIPVVVKPGGNAQPYELKAEKSKAPQKICTFVNAHWADEYVNIRKAYPSFDSWVQAKNPEVWIEDEVERFTDLDLTNND